LHIGTDVPQLKAKGGFDKGTGIARENFLSQGYRKLCPGTETHRDSIGGPDNFLGDEHAIGGDNLVTIHSMLLEPPHPDAVDIANDEVKETHTLRAVPLREIDLLINRS